ncbi:glycosyltransferase family 1 protein [Mucilaginibacter hurinus]|uniref:Glycosyltransferase family 1 protein n=1 Tax=Mucilaginibacter hurinus TaxID=2201324 RepID=A0A367GLX3_9SPHI|nr:glycosyltransferase family 1 protein [Mucilaginibacter hurinus]RCH54330.1 glycosyltransferase family 1 protein [Mucilaginibacter hurinus]
MKRILFDHQIFRKQNFGGISKYFTELMKGVGKESEYKVLPKKFFSKNVHLSESQLTRFSKLNKLKKFPGKGRLERAIEKEEELRTIDILKNGRFDIFQPTYYNPYFLKHLPADKPFVLTVYDMIHENYFDKVMETLSAESEWKASLIPRADHIIAISHHTKKEILYHFPAVDEAKISVVHLAATGYTTEAIKMQGLPQQYILFVGVRKYYKNFQWLAETLNEYLKKSNITLLCAGSGDFDAYERNVLGRIDALSHVKYIPVKGDNEMAALYQNALCFIFPSLEEGFGIPVLEGFINKCPVILSNASCFPEVGGDAALYFEPGNRDDLVEKVSQIVNNKALREELIEKGTERLKIFNWKSTVEQHLKVYERF